MIQDKQREHTTGEQERQASHSFQAFLEYKVPPLIAAMQERGGPREPDWEAAQSFSEALAFRGDVLQFVFDAQSQGAQKKAVSSRDDLAQHVATAAFCPGGIETFGLRFLANARGVTIERLESGWPGPFPKMHEERKSTGSYYTPRSLIDDPRCLLDSALEPVVAEKLQAPDPERALLTMSVVDPSGCGSGAFLWCATERLAKHLAALRYGDLPPTRAQWQQIRRQIIGHCMFGVDLNPTAVELCKLTLSLQAIDPERSFPFLDAHIQRGNGILGATYALMREGIPDAALDPIEGDDKKLYSAYKKRNKTERERQHGLFVLPPGGIPDWDMALGMLARVMRHIDAMPDEFPEGWQAKRDYYRHYLQSDPYQWSLLRANAWCSAFVWKKTGEFPDAITDAVFRTIERDPEGTAPWMRDEINRLAEQYQFFHTELAFPQVLYGHESQAAQSSHTATPAQPQRDLMPVQASLWHS